METARQPTYLASIDRPPHPTALGKPTRVRFGMLALVFVNVVINYMDRTNISVAATSLSGELNFSPVQLGFLFSAFGWTYAAFQIPGGLLADRFGPRILYTFSLIVWSSVTAFQGMATLFTTLFLLRLCVGALEAPAYPINNQIATSWFPQQERARAIAIYTSGQYVGLAFLAPAMAALQYYLGWRMLFITTGAVGVGWGIIWYLFYRDPLDHPRANETERLHIQQGGGVFRDYANPSAQSKINWRDLRHVFAHRKLWGIYIGQFASARTCGFSSPGFPPISSNIAVLLFSKVGSLPRSPSSPRSSEFCSRDFCQTTW